jgi:chaperonin GroES
MLKPIRNNLLVELIQKEKITKSGIVLSVADRDEVNRGVILAVGPEVLDLKVGDNILPNWNAGRQTKHENQDLWIVNEDDVVLVFED